MPTSSSRTRRPRPAVWLTAGLLLLVTGCGGLDKSANPDLVGPADSTPSAELNALPDVLNADGVSQSVIRLVLRDENGAPLANRSVLFQHDGDGYMAPSVGSVFVGPVQSGLVMSTDQDGVAYVVYVAGTEIRTVTVWARAYGVDTARTTFGTIEIMQK